MTDENYLTVKQLANKYEAFSEASLRYWIFHSTSNNLDKAIRRVGKKILIAENDFLSWIENQGVQMSRWYSGDTQIAWACAQLLKGKIINHRDEFTEVNGWRLSAIIHNLRHRYGWLIETEYDGKKIGHYQLRRDTDIDSLELPPSYRDYLNKKPRDK